MSIENPVAYNSQAWSQWVESGNQWTLPVDAEVIQKARQGEWEVVLTPTLNVPKDWFGEIREKHILCLASGGGQQGPVLAAAGAKVTVLDNCPAQLEKDRLVAEREGLTLALVLGDMKDLSALDDASFDLIFHPIANCFIEDVEPVWRECARVLKPGGKLLAGFGNPVTYLFDLQTWDTKNQLEVKYRIPYSDLEQLPHEELKARLSSKEPLEWGHSLDAQIGGQLKAGFIITGFYEDSSGGDFLDPYINSFMATCAVKR